MQEWRIDARAGAMLRIEYGGTLPQLDRSLDHRRVLGAMPPMAAREGSFLHAGSGWYPRPDASFSYRVRLSLPHHQRGLVAGRLLAEEMPRDDRDRYIATFSLRIRRTASISWQARMSCASESCNGPRPSRFGCAPISTGTSMDWPRTTSKTAAATSSFIRG
jgi:hypothetical protein